MSLGPGSDQTSGFESNGEDREEREAFWGLVRLFLQCHEGENKDPKEIAVGDKADHPISSGAHNDSKASKANSK